MFKRKLLICLCVLAIPVVAFTVLSSSLAGCTTTKQSELLKMIDGGKSITLNLSKPSYEVKTVGEQVNRLDWVQLDQLSTYDIFRSDFDSTLSIVRVSENGVNGKSGCLFVGKDNVRDGNTTLADAFRNEVFIEKYWNKAEVRNKLGELSKEAYKDIDGTNNLMASINAYFNLLPDSENPTAFNGTQSLTREQFYTLVYRATTPVKPIEIDKNFEAAVGGKTEYTKYAQGVDEYGFLNVNNKSLDRITYHGLITRAEAVYLVVNKFFKDELKEVSPSDKAFKDTENA
ncbi:hypothetical protein, partial [Clostridium tepidiprofundi]|uniref:hypothetical protein n=1 Tax=Clostridium tepidiprofundi TaxID=420412 RepID=UPI000B0F9229